MKRTHFNLDQNLDLVNSREKIFRAIYITEGEVVMTIDFNEYMVQSPALVFISENQLLNITENSPDLNGSVLHFSNDFFCIKLNRSETFCDAVIFNTTKPPYVQLEEAEANKIAYLFSAMSNELNEANEFQQEIIISQLKTLLLYASKIKLKQYGQFDLSILSSVVSEFQNLLDKKYVEEHNVQFYADALHITTKGLNKAVKKELGRTVSELIKEKVIIEAKRELYTKALSIKEIAYKLGFEDPAYFSRFFKKETSHSPKEYAELL